MAASVTLEWEAPAIRADGSALNDLAGFRVYYGTTPGSYSNTIDIGVLNICVIDGLTAGDTYFFAVTSYDSLGNESEPSNEISRDI